MHVEQHISMSLTSVMPGLGWLDWLAKLLSVFVCKYHVSDMTCINLPCKISIDVSLRTTAHCYIEDVPFRRG